MIERWVLLLVGFHGAVSQYQSTGYYSHNGQFVSYGSSAQPLQFYNEARYPHQNLQQQWPTHESAPINSYVANNQRTFQANHEISAAQHRPQYPADQTNHGGQQGWRNPSNDRGQYTPTHQGSTGQVGQHGQINPHKSQQGISTQHGQPTNEQSAPINSYVANNQRTFQENHEISAAQHRPQYPADQTNHGGQQGWRNPSNDRGQYTPTHQGSTGQVGQHGQTNLHKYQHGMSTQHGQPTNEQSRTYYCTASTMNYGCIYQEVVTQSAQQVNFTPHRYRQVTFENSRMWFFPKNLIDALLNVELLNVASLQIQAIDNNAFQNARYLSQLYMQDNLLTNILQYSFKGANSLTTLILSRNRIQQFHSNALGEMTNLEHLYIDSNRITTIPFVTNNPHLNTLNASHNNIARIGDYSFRTNFVLRELDLAFNEMKLFNTTQLNDKQRLQLVDLSSNQLTRLTIPNIIHTLRANNNSISRIDLHWANCSVSILELSFNQFKSMPDLSRCTNLEKLDLSHNQLEQLDPVQLSAMTQLGSLNVAHNYLFEIRAPPQTVYSNLRWLDLSHNSLSVWPASFLFYYAVALGLSNNKWQCTGLQSVINQHILDRGIERCQSDSTHYDGICCREFSSNNDAQELTKLAELLRDNYIHEYQNKEHAKEQCTASEKYQQRASNQQVSNLRQEAALAEFSKRDVLLELDRLQNEVNENNFKLQETSNQNHLIKSETDLLTRNIDHFVGTYGVPREGLVAPQEMLRRVLAFVSDRNQNNAALLARRKQETQDNAVTLTAQRNETNTEKDAQAVHKETLRKLKAEETNAKAERDRLRAQANRNAANIQGSTGKISG